MSSIDSISQLQPRVIRKHENVPKEVIEAAEAMEEQFANHLIQEMRKSTGKSSGSSAEDFYNSLMDRERAKIMAQSDSGLGVKNVLIDQFMRKNARMNNPYENVKMYKANSQKGENL